MIRMRPACSTAENLPLPIKGRGHLRRMSKAGYCRLRDALARSAGRGRLAHGKPPKLFAARGLADGANTRRTWRTLPRAHGWCERESCWSFGSDGTQMKFFRVVRKWKRSILSRVVILDWTVQQQAAARLTYTCFLVDERLCRLTKRTSRRKIKSFYSDARGRRD
jgi:hypothetical protein